MNATALTAGQPVAGVVVAGDTTCFHAWDATGVCRVFEITAPADGTLDVLVVAHTSMTRDILDLFLVDPGRSWIAAFEGATREAATMRVTRGRTYGILVMSYAADVPMAFELRADVRD